MHYRHIIWDWNGTIVDDVQLAVELTNRALTEAGLSTITLEQHRKHFELPIVNFYRAVGFDVTEERFLELDKNFHHGYDSARPELQPFQDVPVALKQFAARGASSSILSALPKPLLDSDVAHLGFAGTFEHVLGRRGSTAGSKVDQGKELLATLGLKPHEVLVIGDTIYDAEVAHAVGADCALISRGHQDVERLKSTNPSFLVDSIEVLLQRLVVQER